MHYHHSAFLPCEIKQSLCIGSYPLIGYEGNFYLGRRLFRSKFAFCIKIFFSCLAQQFFERIAVCKLVSYSLYCLCFAAKRKPWREYNAVEIILSEYPFPNTSNPFRVRHIMRCILEYFYKRNYHFLHLAAFHCRY